MDELDKKDVDHVKLREELDALNKKLDQVVNGEKVK